MFQEGWSLWKDSVLSGHTCAQLARTVECLNGGSILALYSDPFGERTWLMANSNLVLPLEFRRHQSDCNDRIVLCTCVRYLWTRQYIRHQQTFNLSSNNSNILKETAHSWDHKCSMSTKVCPNGSIPTHFKYGKLKGAYHALQWAPQLVALVE